ncbi:MAG: peptidylprolyl isomerase [Methyloligellaceae bacterium]
MRFAIGLLAFFLVITAGPTLEAREPADRENTLYLKLKYGRVIIKLRPDLAPKHVERVKKLVREGFYDGLTFHRVIPGFMAQTGDPTGTGGGGSKYPNLPQEFTDTPFARGTIGAARTSDPNSANSQFFICFDAAPWLNGKYTVWGHVVIGMKFVDLIAKGDTRSGKVAEPDKIVAVTVAADAKK